MTKLAQRAPVGTPHPAYVAHLENSALIWISHRDQFNDEGMGASLLAMVGQEHIDAANEILARYEAQGITAADAARMLGERQ